MGLGLESLAEIGFFGCERVAWASDADSAGARDVVDVLEVGEVGVRLGDGLGVGLLLLVLGERAVDARDAGGLTFALAGRDDQVGLDLLDRLSVRAAPEDGVQHVLGDDGRSAAVLALACRRVEPLEGRLPDVLPPRSETVLVIEQIIGRGQHLRTAAAAAVFAVNTAVLDMRRDQAALSALLKLRQVLPTRIASRLGELDAAFTYTARPDEGQISPALLLDLATACRRGERIRPTYRDRAGTMSTRRVDPLDGGWRPLRPTQVNESGTTFMLNP